MGSYAVIGIIELVIGFTELVSFIELVIGIMKIVID